MTTDNHWRTRAACAGEDPELFFPDVDDEGLEAKAICLGCPVRKPCLGHALTHRLAAGIWGGLDAAERRNLPRDDDGRGEHVAIVINLNDYRH